jgi:hypothetical protein
MPDPINQEPKPQPIRPKRLSPVHRKRRKRVSALTTDERKRIVFLFDWNGDPDYVAERCGIIGVQRGDVLAVVLMDTRRRGPGWERPMGKLA